MEVEGFPLDTKVLSEINDEYTLKVNQLDKEIKELTGKEFNINSPKQLEEVLFFVIKYSEI